MWLNRHLLSRVSVGVLLDNWWNLLLSFVGWRAHFEPETHPVTSTYEFNVLIGADGRRNSLHGFQHKEFRGKLAIGVTCNFVNHHTRNEQNFEGTKISLVHSSFSSLSVIFFRNQWCSKNLQSSILQWTSTANIDRSGKYCLLQKWYALLCHDSEKTIPAG